MSNNALPFTPMYPCRWLLSAVVVCGIASTGAFAQSRKALDAVRFHRRDARPLVQSELTQCLASNCGSASNLSLLAGHLALLEGQPEAAALQLKAHPAPPGLEAFRAFYLGEALYQTYSYAEAAEVFAQALAFGAPILEARIESRLGISLAKAGLYDSALHRLARAIRFRATAELVAARAAAFEATANLAAAEADWRYLTVHFPTDERAKEGIEFLLRHHPSDSIFNFDERLIRARALSEGGQLKNALDELTAASNQKLLAGSAPFAKLALVRAQIQYALGDDAAAEKEVKRASAGPAPIAAEALMLRAKRTLRTDDTAKTRDQMAELERKFPRQPQADEAGFLLGWLDIQAGRYSNAIKAFDAFEHRHPRSPHGDDAQWLKSLALIRLQRFAQAHSALNRLMARFPKSTLVPRARYWEVRVDQLSGKALPLVSESYREIVRTFPGSFYALLAQRRLREMGEEAPLSFLPLSLDSKPTIPDALRLAATLSAVGLFRDAREEMHRNAIGIRDVREAADWGLALQQLDEYGQAYALAARVLWGAAYTAKDAIPLALLFPRAFRPIVEDEAILRNVSPFFIWSIMRRESTFQPDTVSVANARGLLQVVPRTGISIAKKLGEAPPLPEDLFSPEVNVHLGTWYLGELRKRFKHPVTTAAAYNAGPGVVAKWVEANGDMPVDLFIESIPYKETRGYVKQVCADLANYHALYSEETAMPDFPLQLPKPDEPGVDF